MDQPDLDVRIQDYYTNQFSESERLRTRSAQGRLEFERVQELVGTRIAPQSKILDVGGATGVHAVALAEQGHDVVLIDPVPDHVATARRCGTFSAEIGDARELRFPDDAFDVVLLFGPLYHLASQRIRIDCLREAKRVTRAGGWLFAAVITRFACHTVNTLGREELPGKAYPDELIAMLERGEAPATVRFPGGHFHTGEELLLEMAAAGLPHAEAHAIEGANGFALEELPAVDEEIHQAALSLVRLSGHLPGIRDMTNHLMGIARVLK
ncbi:MULTISPECIES: bifunctional 2-polyprenyl-6-hydroxyphenol methylase/3-demethylubiquinol 3-O-methyltransferase UbiG [unclassified Mycolicibacterium]|uniref:class I SAM-dependent methyltransferase n=1 Tax=unclassified Mycolicibacterium TaxID=2636767 RepID=UPI0012DF6574|nr:MULTISPECIES: class I SAM-dependent methyltransferase [unclassified Mycolicibacterium]MUL83729.1 class I SAM-dependent methyltransferase [Mycolicibacterium sp. CBMA 329]MUL90720.1 class I SAM-dependent methyltransferase [Mycolicibacterium sp. CBMA 331]MUM00689.1 class I SAM-dependent methyltransferase [Mycolicibacterium sp. CBMA 334]MUM29743.1 class I SAM-dependent methyltransferase [Mycolicibacterium sp. CBMA 295]MUM41664.1 class I SAM-dependent methyltransferase [Mycolicibacterium sp. CBM